jgi:hypothetical protein
MLADLDRAVEEELEAAARAAAAEAAARTKLEEAKLAAEKDSWERREAAARASRSAARERQRTTGSVPRLTTEDGDLRWTSEAEDAPGGASGPAKGAPPLRKAVSEGGVSVWGKPPRNSRWDDAEAAAAAQDPAHGEAGAEHPDGEDVPAASGAGAADGTGAGEARQDVADQAAGRPDDADRPDAQDEPGSEEMTQAFLPDFLKDDSEAPADIAAASGRDETEALERPNRRVSFGQRVALPTSTRSERGCPPRS